MEELLFAVMLKKFEIMNHNDVSDPAVNKELNALADDFKYVLANGELPPKSSERWVEQ